MTLFPVLAGPALLLAAGYAVTVVAPATAKVNTTRTQATREYTKAAVKGRKVYAANGCVQCHTLQRRDAFTDTTTGRAPSGPAEDLNDVPALQGQARYGPDLSCIGDRAPRDANVDALMRYLEDPAAVHHGSAMPSYRFLSGDDLRRLASFLAEHTCDEGTAP
ncbi:MAG TPA: cbb3-type cytochrome c oxidase subunit II [Mycobacteriales bacterium]|jgi:cytochrome c oxidase cbb3-type subunit 2|nr:cbb3-type cytochrome c oxidase subunit II [Mycobacteriales bacterium]